MNSTSARDFSTKVQHFLRLDTLSPGVRKVIIGAIGGLVLLAGFAMIFLPGPAFIVIPLGLAVLATEFGWARDYLHKARDWFERKRAKHAAKKKNRGSGNLLRD